MWGKVGGLKRGVGIRRGHHLRVKLTTVGLVRGFVSIVVVAVGSHVHFFKNLN